jgi:hypothetical protein
MTKDDSSGEKQAGYDFIAPDTHGHDLFKEEDDGPRGRSAVYFDVHWGVLSTH